MSMSMSMKSIKSAQIHPDPWSWYHNGVPLEKNITRSSHEPRNGRSAAFGSPCPEPEWFACVVWCPSRASCSHSRVPRRQTPEIMSMDGFLWENLQELVGGWAQPPWKIWVRQIGSSSQLLGKIKNVPNHQPGKIEVFYMFFTRRIEKNDGFPASSLPSNQINWIWNHPCWDLPIPVWSNISFWYPMFFIFCCPNTLKPPKPFRVLQPRYWLRWVWIILFSNIADIQ